MTYPSRPAVSGRRASRQALPAQSLVVASSALALLGMPLLVPPASAAFEDAPKATLDEAWQIVNETYVDPSFNRTDWQEVRHTLLAPDYTSPEAAYDALRQALEKLDDPYTRFMDPAEFSAFTNQTNGELVGVGIQLMVNPDTKILTVVQPIQGTPAMEAGVLAGDHILAIDGEPTDGMTADAAANLIRGEAGTALELLLQREGAEPFPVSLSRRQISVPVVTSSLKQEGDQRIGYLHLSEFNAHAAEQVQQAMAELEPQVDAYVLDLRNNPGGMLNQAIAIAQMWLDPGDDIVRTVDRVGHAEEASAAGTALTQKPLTVLVNGNSASASEVLSGALQDNQRAVLVGTQTFGKAVVQLVNSLEDGSGLNVTVAHYYTPAGTDINHRGITPDVLVETNERELWTHPERVATAADAQYMAAVAQLTRQVAVLQEQ